MIFVVDTNVVMSGVLRPASKPGRILDLMLEHRISFVASTELIEEYREVLCRPKFGFNKGLVDALVDALDAGSEHVVAMPQRTVLSEDPKDQFVIDLALVANAYIVTGNARHFTAYERVVSTAEAFGLLGG